MFRNLSIAAHFNALPTGVPGAVGPNELEGAMPNAFGPRCNNCGATVEPTIGGAFVFRGSESRNVGPAPDDCPYCGDALPFWAIKPRNSDLQ